MAREKRLKPLARYLSSTAPKTKQRPSEMLVAFQEMQAAGAPLRIRKIG